MSSLSLTEIINWDEFAITALIPTTILFLRSRTTALYTAENKTSQNSGVQAVRTEWGFLHTNSHKGHGKISWHGIAMAALWCYRDTPLFQEVVDVCSNEHIRKQSHWVKRSSGTLKVPCTYRPLHIAGLAGKKIVLTFCHFVSFSYSFLYLRCQFRIKIALKERYHLLCGGGVSF